MVKCACNGFIFYHSTFLKREEERPVCMPLPFVRNTEERKSKEDLDFAQTVARNRQIRSGRDMW